MKDCVLVFFKLMLVIWWIILGIIITVAAFHAENCYMTLLALLLMSVWVSLSGTAIYWSDKDCIGKH